MTNEFLSGSEVARLLGVTPQTVSAMFDKGKFPNAFKFGGLLRIPPSDVEKAKEQPWKKAMG